MPKRNHHRPTREQMAKEAERYLLMGYTQTETGEMLGVAPRTLRNWACEGLLTMPTREQVSAYRAENAGGMAAPPASAPSRQPEEGVRPSKRRKTTFPPVNMTVDDVYAEMARRAKKGSFEDGVRQDFEFLYARLALVFREMTEAPDVSTRDPGDLLAWAKLLDTFSERVRGIDAQNGKHDEPEDEGAQRAELQRRRQSLAEQYAEASAEDKTLN